jgi:hypothetical protein
MTPKLPGAGGRPSPGTWLRATCGGERGRTITVSQLGVAVWSVKEFSLKQRLNPGEHDSE